MATPPRWAGADPRASETVRRLAARLLLDAGPRPAGELCRAFGLTAGSVGGSLRHPWFAKGEGRRAPWGLTAAGRAAAAALPPLPAPLPVPYTPVMAGAEPSPPRRAAGSPPPVGPLAEAVPDPDAGGWREVLRPAGKAAVDALLLKYPRPFALARTKWPRLYWAANRAGLTDDDLHQLACEAVCRAAARFRPETGNQLQTYATWWIRAVVQRAVKAQGRAALATTGGDSAGRDKGERGGGYELASVPGPPADPADRAHAGDVAGWAARALAALAPRDRTVMVLRYGLDGNGARSLDEVGAAIGVTKERVRQLELRAVRRIRNRAGDYGPQLLGADPGDPADPGGPAG